MSEPWPATDLEALATLKAQGWHISIDDEMRVWIEKAGMVGTCYAPSTPIYERYRRLALLARDSESAPVKPERVGRPIARMSESGLKNIWATIWGWRFPEPPKGDIEPPPFPGIAALEESHPDGLIILGVKIEVVK